MKRLIEKLKRKRTDAQTPAPEGDRIKGSDSNEPGSAKTGSGGISFSPATTKALQAKSDASGVSLGKLKAVYRRGAGAFSTSHRPGMTRGQWAMARVNAFIHLAKTGKPKNPRYTQDNDLLESEGFTPPQAVRKAAKLGLELRREHGHGGTNVGVARARDLSNGKAIPIETIKRMHSFFSRHAAYKFKHSEEPTGPARISWLLWGGDAGRRWVKSILR